MKRTSPECRCVAGKRKDSQCRSAARRASPECDSAAELPSMVAYMDCPRNRWRHAPELLSQTIQYAVEVGATILNVTVDRQTDEAIVFCTMSSALGNAWLAVRAGTVMSFYKAERWQLLNRQTIDPENVCPALMLTLCERQSPGTQMSVVTVSLPTLPTRGKDRLLQAYVDEATQTKSHAVVIGGIFNPNEAPLLWLENRVNKLDFDIEVSSNEKLCVLPWCTTGSMKCIKLDGTGPHALVIEHQPNSAERPAESTPTHASENIQQGM